MIRRPFARGSMASQRRASAGVPGFVPSFALAVATGRDLSSAIVCSYSASQPASQRAEASAISSVHRHNPVWTITASRRCIAGQGALQIGTSRFLGAGSRYFAESCRHGWLQTQLPITCDASVARKFVDDADDYDEDIEADDGSPVFTIIGGGRVGLALADIYPDKAVVVRRGETIPKHLDGPIIICTRNDDLGRVIDETPEHRRKDLVFIQNGMLQTWLADRGLGDNTQALIYFAVALLGDSPTDGGGTVVWGPWGQEIAKRLRRGGLECTVLENKVDFDRQMIEKLLWICVFGIICARHNVCVGYAAETYYTEIDALATELAGVAERAIGVKLDDGITFRLCKYAVSVYSFEASVKEFDWRNGWFLKQEKSPLHYKYLNELGFAS